MGNWKAATTLVDTSHKTPLVHSPGVTFAALDHAVQGCAQACKGLIVSKGFEHQLPIRDDARVQFEQKYPNIELVTKESGEAAAYFNECMEKGILAVLMLHTTC